MNAFDAGILRWLNGFAHHSAAFDAGMKYLSDLYLVKGELFMAAVWWAWFPAKEREERDRSVLLATILSAFAAIILGRALAHLVPYRIRPVFNPVLAFVPPVGAGDATLRTWSAFPSDHAMIFSALATGLWFVSRRVGVAAHLFWIAVIGFPRVYLGLHHPTDVIAGGALGAGLAWAANAEGVRRVIDSWAVPFRAARPGLFYAGFFLVSFQIGTMFDEPRLILLKAARLLRGRGPSAASEPAATP